MQLHAAVHYCPCIIIFAGTIPITSSLVQSTKANFTINGTEGVMYTCNVNNQIVTIKAGQPVPQTGLHPNTSYTINCQANGCLVANTTFITGLFAIPQ